MTVTVNCGTGGRQAKDEKVCRIFDSLNRQACTIWARHIPATRRLSYLELEMDCGKGVNVLKWTVDKP